jgi:hypothetical protein
MQDADLRADGRSVPRRKTTLTTMRLIKQSFTKEYQHKLALL